MNSLLKNITIVSALVLSSALLSACGEDVVSTSVKNLKTIEGVSEPDTANLSEEVLALAAKAELEVVAAALADCREKQKEDATADLGDYCDRLIAANPDATTTEINLPEAAAPETATGDDAAGGDAAGDAAAGGDAAGDA